MLNQRLFVAVAAGAPLLLAGDFASADAITVQGRSSNTSITVEASAGPEFMTDFRQDNDESLLGAYSFNELINVYAMSDDGPFDPGEFDPDEFDSTAAVISVFDDASADASLAYSDDVLMPDGDTLQIAYSYNGNTMASNNGNASATSTAAGSLILEIHLDTQATYDLQGAFSIDPFFNGNVLIELAPSIGSPITTYTQNDSILDEQGTLDPGTYAFVVMVDQESVADDLVFSVASQLNTIDFTLDIVAVPEPTSLALLALPGLLIARRRR